MGSESAIYIGGESLWIKNEHKYMSKLAIQCEKLTLASPHHNPIKLDYSAAYLAS